MKKSDDRAKKTALALLDWLILDYPYGHLFAHGISEDISPENDKKRKLSVLISMEHALQTWNKLGTTSKESSTESNSMADSNKGGIGPSERSMAWGIGIFTIHDDGYVEN